MNRALSVLGAAVVFAGIAVAGPVQAADPRLPAALYPPGTELTYQPQVSNAEMDCSWGFACDSQRAPCHRFCPRSISLMHLRTQDQLHRTDGWSQFGDDNEHGQSTQFVLYASAYASGSDRIGTPWSLQALLDLRLTAWLHGYAPLVRPTSIRGTVVAMDRAYGNASVLLLAYRVGSQEVEAMVTSVGRPKSVQHMEDYLAQQVSAAVAYRAEHR